MRKYNIATAPSRLSKTWRNHAVDWTWLVDKCRNCIRTPETAAEWRRMNRDDRARVKDQGGFVGGYLRDGKRKGTAVVSRSMLTLDLDHVPAAIDVWDDFTFNYTCAALIYSTHSHTPEAPRLRLVIPLSRDVEPDEYEAVARRIAESVGLPFFDSTTFEACRLFYWPSASSDAPYIFNHQAGAPLDPDRVLASYPDWRDRSAWPGVADEAERVGREAVKAEDPTAKKGLVGAWCRAFTIEDAIDRFLPDVYTPAVGEGRYTYTGGSVAGGVVCYEGKWAYSHHDTDPASRRLCNAYDLVRIHKFGDLDKDGERNSTRAMNELATETPEVRRQLAVEQYENACRDFEGLTEADVEEFKNSIGEWADRIECNKSGDPLPSADNIILILDNDPGLKGRVWRNYFSGFDEVEGGLPWKTDAKSWTNSDDANLRVYIERLYGIQGRDKIRDAKEWVATRDGRHPVRDYLTGLTWDGVERLDRAVIHYIGAPDTELNRALTRKFFTAAVARIMTPGVKFDYCLLLAGKQGIGKSTIFSVMGGGWFSDTMGDITHKDGLERMQGKWIIETAELTSLKRAEVEDVKSHLSRQEDYFRPAYGAVVEKRPRQCVFCGTTNEAKFLKGDTGNRRFWVIQVDDDLRTYSDVAAMAEALSAERDQLWAEAVARWREGEKLYLDPLLEAQARAVQEEVNESQDDPRPGMLAHFLDTPLPVDWAAWSLDRRRAWWCKPDPLDPVGSEPRTRVSPVEFLCEVCGIRPGDPGYRRQSNEIVGMLFNLGWLPVGASRHAAGIYGVQKAFARPGDGVTDKDTTL